VDPGEIIAQRYKIDRKLGEGGMGTVYEAEHVITGRRLAIKILERRDKLPAEALDRFLQEARAPAKIGHPNIVEVLDAGTEPDGTPFIAMELLEGETLDEVIKRDHVVQPRALAAIMDQLLEGLGAMHARGLVHRDLKPANIFLCRGGSTPLRVKLLDFGIAKALGEEGRTKSGYVIGTPAYMAPEQMRNARSATPKSDLWSVGVMLYECLAGHRPFRGETFGLLAQISGPSPSPALAAIAPALPPALTDLVDALLAKDLGSRPGSASEVRARLLPALAACPDVRRIEPPDDEADAIGHAATAHSETRRSDEHDPAWRDDVPDEPAPSPASVSGDAIPLERRRSNDLPMRIGLATVVLAVAVGAGLLVAHGFGSHDGPHVHHDDPNANAARTVASSRELTDFLHQWLGTVTGSQGQSSLAAFYTDPVKFRGANGMSTPSAVQRAWGEMFAGGGSFVIDWDRSSWTEEAPDLNQGVSTACVNVPGATGRVVKVRAWATEVVRDRVPAIGCPRLEGVYLLRLRHVGGALRICHETWSLREGICASCPDAEVCRTDGGARP
jgi:serine/threonine protein kinase